MRLGQPYFLQESAAIWRRTSLPNRRPFGACHIEHVLGGELGTSAGDRVFLVPMAKRPRSRHSTVA